MISNDNTMHTKECKCFAWKPIIAGAIIIIGLSFLLNLFSVAIGLTAFNTNNEGVESLVLGGLIGTGIGIVASMFAGGWITGYLGQRYCTQLHLGALYGFLAWCLALIIAAFIAGHLQEYVSFYGHVLSDTTEVMQVHKAAADNIAVSTNVKADSLMISTYIIFCLFFLSAFAASLGGHCGMRFRCKKTGTCT